MWYFAGLQFKGNANTSQVNAMLKELSTIYNINFFVWLPLIIIIVCLLFKISTVPSMLISSVSAIVIGAFNNGFKVTDGFKATFDGFNKSMVPNLHGSLSEKAINLIEQGGMMSMTEIVVTIFCGYAFAGIVEKAGCLDVILKKISSNINSVGTLILATVVGGLMMVLAAGVASVVIIMVGVLMMDMYNKMGLDRSNLSRTLEDSGTMIIPLIPWGTSGIYYTQQLGVSVDQFFIWAVPCYLCVFFAIFYGFSGIGIKKAKVSEG